MAFTSIYLIFVSNKKYNKLLRRGTKKFVINILEVFIYSIVVFILMMPSNNLKKCIFK